MFYEESIYVLTVTMHVNPVRFRIVLVGRAYCRNDRAVPRASLCFSPDSYCRRQKKRGEKVRVDYKLTVMPISTKDFHSHQARLRVYLHGAPSPVKIVFRGPEIIDGSCGARSSRVPPVLSSAE